ncbi:hypothetical protein IL314_10535 [Enterococcus faecium]|uniref:Uncharacterized protein n=1 Tax=Enterococcus faecium TaxID=1352 RepID=A0A7V7KSB4_ENTFC|nr:hypothetical protein DTX73_09020 [Enterococcus faecium]MBK5027569.1 hypothetical protein [Enterococcus faecium]MBK5038068.1 hypothetical protein [Enterococcus faecium]MBK5043068.1 hypothetical protein [Enterococcus faecium]MBK5068234.1 hypothetical protein [Enterococcus faecium]
MVNHHRRIVIESIITEELKILRRIEITELYKTISITAVINIIGVSNIVVLGALNYTILTFILSVFIALIIGMTLITFTQHIEKTEIL